MSNLFQIGQQTVMLRLGHIGPEAMERRLEQVRAKAAAKGDKPRGGFMAKMMERAEQERTRRGGDATPLRKPPPRTAAKGSAGTAPKRSAGTSASRPKGPGSKKKKRGR
jgi:hypothetical protein